MKSESTWKPSKFVFNDRMLQGSRDPNEVAISSRLHVDLLAAALQETVGDFCTGRVLDLGCGKVPLYALYKPLATSVTCADWPNSFHPLQHIDFDCNLLEPLPIPDRHFDSIILTDVLEHIPTPRDLLHELHRVLDGGGVVIGSVPFLYRLHEEPHDYYRYTSHALNSLAVEAGFEVIRLRPYGAGLDVVCDLVAKLIVDLHWRLGPIAANLVQRAGLSLRNTRLGKRLVNDRADMPLGYLFVLKRSAP